MSGASGSPAAVVGFDTSNYRTSVAAVTLDGEILVNHRELLPVADGERGLRQSDAVFAHIRQIRNAEAALRAALKNTKIAAAAASTRPRDGEQSYMPVFQVGHTAGCMLAAALDIPFYETTHQRGHLAAALAGSGHEGRRLLAVHLSGGTTGLLALDDDAVRQIGGSADLHAGQLVDRAGVAMGLPFPSGEALEALAVRGKSEGRLGCAEHHHGGNTYRHGSGDCSLQKALLRLFHRFPLKYRFIRNLQLSKDFNHIFFHWARRLRF